MRVSAAGHLRRRYAALVVILGLAVLSAASSLQAPLMTFRSMRRSSLLPPTSSLLQASSLPPPSPTPTSAAPRAPSSTAATLVVSHHDEDLAWLWALLDDGLCGGKAEAAVTWSVWLSEKTAAGAASALAALSPGGAAGAHAACVTVSEEPGGNWGREAVPFLRYIETMYEALPATAVFVHGAALQHTPALGRWLRCLDPRWPADGSAAHGFVSMAPHFMAGQLLERRAPSMDVFAALARKATAGVADTSSPLVNLSFSPTAHSCCATFVAARAALRQRSHSFWSALLEVALNAGRVDSPYEGQRDQWAAAYMEQVWHHVLGEPLALPAPTPLCSRGAATPAGVSPFFDTSTCPESPCGEEVH